MKEPKIENFKKIKDVGEAHNVISWAHGTLLNPSDSWEIDRKDASEYFEIHPTWKNQIQDYF